MRRDSTAAADTWHHRVDRGELLSAHTRPDGVLLLEGYAAREGIMEYIDERGVTRELVTPEALRSGAATLGRAPVTLEHPDGDVTPETYAALGVGDVDGEVELDAAGFVRVKIAVRRADAIAAVRSGKVELSPGYSVLLDMTPGTHPVHGRYDARQIARKVNHLAIVDTARGGPEIRVRVDTTTTRTALHAIRTDQEVRMNAELLRALALLGISSRCDSDAAALDLISAEMRRRKDEAEAAAVAADASEEDLTAKIAELTTALAAAKEELAAMKGTADAEADKADRAALAPLCTRLAVDAAKHADTKLLRRALAAAHLGTALRSDATDDYVRAVCDLASKTEPVVVDPWVAARVDATDPAKKTARKGPGAASLARYTAAFGGSDAK